MNYIQHMKNILLITIKLCKNFLNKLYIDGRLSDTVFSKEPIPPTAIEIFEN